MEFYFQQGCRGHGYPWLYLRDFCIIMVDEGSHYILQLQFLFLFCQHRWKTSHGISTKLGKLACRLEVVSICKCPKNISGVLPNLRNKTSHRQIKILASIYNMSPTSWPTFRYLWPQNGWDPLAHWDPPMKIQLFPSLPGFPHKGQ